MWQWVFYVLLMWAVMLKCAHVFKLYSLAFSWIMCGLLLHLVVPVSGWGSVFQSLSCGSDLWYFLCCPNQRQLLPSFRMFATMVRAWSPLLSVTSIFRGVSQHLMGDLLKACAGTCWRITTVIILAWLIFELAFLIFWLSGSCSVVVNILDKTWSKMMWL